MARTQPARPAFRLSVSVVLHLLCLGWTGYLLAVQRRNWQLKMTYETCNCGATSDPESNCLVRGLTPATQYTVLQHAERSYQENLRRRQSIYGKDPFSGLHRLGDGIPPGLKPEKHPASSILELFAPTYPCFPAERFGSWDGAGKFVCWPHRLTSASRVFSIRWRQAEDSFERELFLRTKAEIHVVTLEAARDSEVNGSTLKPPYTVHGLGIARSGDDQHADFVRLQNFMGSAGTTIDVLNLDCRGCEYEILPSILEARAKAPFGQVLLKLYDTQKRGSLARLLERMERSGYRLFHLEPKWRWTRTLDLAYVHETLCK